MAWPDDVRETSRRAGHRLRAEVVRLAAQLERLGDQLEVEAPALARLERQGGRDRSC